MKPRNADPPEAPRPSFTSLLSNELEPEEVERLLRESESDPDADQELDLLADLVAASELEREILLASLPESAFTQADERTAHPRATVPAIVLQVVALAAAAALVLLLFRSPDGAADAPQGLAPPVYFPSEQRLSRDSLARELARAMEPYAEGDLTGALASLDAFLAVHPEHAAARFYRAAALEGLARPTEAEPEYRVVSETASGYLGEHARWRLAHLFVVQDREAEARAELEGLVEAAGAFAPNAVTLLEERAGGEGR